MNKCRICLNSLNNKNAISIYNSWQDDVKIYLKIMDCTDIIILENDVNMPNSICLQCFENLNNFYLFRNLCRESDIQLKSNIILVENEPVAEIIESDLESKHNYIKNYNENDAGNLEQINSHKLINIPNLESTFKLIDEYKNIYLCNLCGSTIAGHNGKHNLIRHLETIKHRSIISSTKFAENENMGVEDIKTKYVFNEENIVSDLINEHDYVQNFKIEICNEKSVRVRKMDETTKLSDARSLKSIFKLIDESKKLYLCNLCGCAISVRGGKYHFIRHLETIKHCSNLYSTKSTKNENTEVENGKKKSNVNKLKIESILESKNDCVQNYKIEIDNEKSVRKLGKTGGKTNKLISKSIFKLIDGSKNIYLCKVCKCKISLGRGSYNFKKHLTTNKHRSKEFSTKYLHKQNSVVEDEKTNIDNGKNTKKVEETNKLIETRNLKLIFKLINKLKNIYLCNLCGSTIADHNGKHNLIRHLETIKHRSIISSTKSAENENSSGIEDGEIKSDDAEHGQSSKDVFLTSLEKDLNDISKDPIEIDKLTEASRILESKRRKLIFHLKLQEEFKADFEIDKNSKFNAFCKTCKQSISIQSSGRADLVNHMNTYKHKGINLIRSKSNNKICDEIVHNVPTFICKICGNVYNKMFKLKKHKLSHNDNNTISCKICHKKFHQGLHIRSHMRVHTGQKLFKCRFCGKCFAQHSTKIRHERTHTDEKFFPCQTRGKRFRSVFTRNAHVRIHTSEKPYSCETCNVVFTKKRHLQAHYKSRTHQILVLA